MCRGEFFLKRALRGLLGKNYNREKNVRKKDKRRPRVMLLDWIMKEDYSKLKERAGHRDALRHWTIVTCHGMQSTEKKKIRIINSAYFCKPLNSYLYNSFINYCLISNFSSVRNFCGIRVFNVAERYNNYGQKK